VQILCVGHLAGHLQPVQDGLHDDIEDDEIRLRLPHGTHALIPVGGAGHLIAGPLQDRPGDLDEIRVVVHNQDPLHAIPLRAAGPAVGAVCGAPCD